MAHKGGGRKPYTPKLVSSQGQSLRVNGVVPPHPGIQTGMFLWYNVGNAFLIANGKIFFSKDILSSSAPPPPHSVVFVDAHS